MSLLGREGGREGGREAVVVRLRIEIKNRETGTIATTTQSCPPTFPPSFLPVSLPVLVLEGSPLSIPQMLEKAMLDVAGESFLQKREGGREGGIRLI